MISDPAVIYKEFIYYQNSIFPITGQRSSVGNALGTRSNTTSEVGGSNLKRGVLKIFARNSEFRGSEQFKRLRRNLWDYLCYYNTWHCCLYALIVIILVNFYMCDHNKRIGRSQKGIPYTLITDYTAIRFTRVQIM